MSLLRTRVLLTAWLASDSLPEILARLTARTRAPTGATPGSLSRIVAPIERLIARSRVVPDTCLYRSLGRYAVLQDAGVPARFVMGLRPEGDDVVGHAWIEVDGRPLGEVVDPRFVVTYSYPAVPATTMQ